MNTMRSKIPTQQQIIDLAKNNPTVWSLLQYWRDERMSWEEAMMFCVLILAHQNESLELQAIKHMELSNVPSFQKLEIDGSIVPVLISETIPTDEVRLIQNKKEVARIVRLKGQTQ